MAKPKADRTEYYRQYYKNIRKTKPQQEDQQGYFASRPVIISSTSTSRKHNWMGLGIIFTHADDTGPELPPESLQQKLHRDAGDLACTVQKETENAKAGAHKEIDNILEKHKNRVTEALHKKYGYRINRVDEAEEK